MQRWHFCAFWRVLLLPPLLGPRSGCTQREAMINGGNHAYGARTFQIYMGLGGVLVVFTFQFACEVVFVQCRCRARGASEG